MNSMMKYIKYAVFVLVGMFIGAWLFSDNKSQTEGVHGSSVEHVEEWTCSMHPQVRLDAPGQCPICGMDLIPVENESERPETIMFNETSLNLAGVAVKEIKKRSPEKKIELLGKLISDESKRFDQVAHFPGRIEKLNISYQGAAVLKGQKIAEVYSPEMITAQKELIESANRKSEVPGLYSAIRKKLVEWKISEKLINEIERSKKIMDYLPLYAEASGYVSAIRVKRGDYFSKGQSLFILESDKAHWAVFDAYEKDIAFIRKNMVIVFSSTDRTLQNYKGKIEFVDPEIHMKGNVFKIRTTVANPDRVLKPGMTLKGTVMGNLTGDKAVLAVPKSAVLWTGPRSVVYVQEPEHAGHFQFREIEIGDDLGEYYVVKNGLSEGELVVANGAFSVDAAAQLQGKESMMNRLQETAGHMPDPLDKKQFSPAAKNAANKIIGAYLQIKNSLVSSNSTLVNKAGSDLADGLSIFSSMDEVSLLSDALSEALPFLNKQANIMKTSKDVDEQRRFFKPLSQNIILLAKEVGGFNEKLYIQYCPMAFDNAGGYWISEESRILNPYYGDKMLRCGSVKDTLYAIK